MIFRMVAIMGFLPPSPEEGALFVDVFSVCSYDVNIFLWSESAIG